AKNAPYMSDDTDPREAWADGYNAAVEEKVLSVGALREALCFQEIRKVIQEMRARKVNHGKHVSPTLIAWADRLAVAVSGADTAEPHYTANLDVRDLLNGGME